MSTFDEPSEEEARQRYEAYQARLEHAREFPNGWPYDIEQTSARLFEAVPERFTFADVQAAARRATLNEEELRGYVQDWQRREMMTKSGDVYVKTGHRPYRTDLGMLSKGSGFGSNLDPENG
ncbi:MAG: hypothetical protein ACR2GR_00425 [Rhodothermales bacterium]